MDSPNSLSSDLAQSTIATKGDKWLKGIDLLLEVLWIEVGGFERSVFVWIILRVRHSPLSSIIMYS